ncbi:hypothetical protein HRbin20_01681 [bacterium HR20]|nr:hypothetical protein HRbin20_01681 [bacterium HR20]
MYAVGVEDEIVGHARLVVREVDAQRQHQRDRQFVGQRDECIAAPKANATGIVETAAALCDQFEFAFGRDGKFECASRVALGLRNSSAAFEVADADIGANSGQSVSSADAAAQTCGRRLRLDFGNCWRWCFRALEFFCNVEVEILLSTIRTPVEEGFPLARRRGEDFVGFCVDRRSEVFECTDRDALPASHKACSKKVVAAESLVATRRKKERAIARKEGREFVAWCVDFWTEITECIPLSVAPLDRVPQV